MSPKAFSIDETKELEHEDTIETLKGKQSESRIESKMNGRKLMSPDVRSPEYKKDDRKSSARSKKSRMTDRIVDMHSVALSPVNAQALTNQFNFTSGGIASAGCQVTLENE